MKYCVFIILFISFVVCKNRTYAQELKADVYINTSNVERVNQQLINILSLQIKDALNTTKFTNIHFTEKEKIDCKFSINLLGYENDEYTAELVVQASRPVFDTNYNSPIFLYKDKNVNFRYNAGEQIVFDINNPASNLVSVFIYYAYMLIDVYLSSFSYFEGNFVSPMIHNIIASAQSYIEWNGWKSSDKNNRISLYESFTQKQDELFWNIWYQYHIKGLDILISDMKKGKENITTVLSSLEQYKKDRFSSPLIDFFGNVKLDEIINIFLNSSSQERELVHKILNNIYPTYFDKLERLRKGENQ